MQMAFKEQSQKLAIVMKESSKTGLYKDTVKKQEQVIAKLETLLEKLMRERKIRDSQETDMRMQEQLQNDANFLSGQDEQLRMRVKRQE